MIETKLFAYKCIECDAGFYVMEEFPTIFCPSCGETALDDPITVFLKKHEFNLLKEFTQAMK